MNIYYAHPVSLYGSKQEERDIQLLEKLGFTVINPNNKFHEEQYKIHGMDYFRTIIRKQCHALAFRTFPDGSIPAGTANEIDCAEEEEYPIIELPNGVYRRRLTIAETREMLKEIGYR